MTKINRILIYGESWRGAVSHSILLALTRLGYNSIIFDYQKYLLSFKISINRIFNKFGYILDQFYFEKRCLEINKRFLQCIEDFCPELIIVVKGLHILPETLKKIKKMGIPVVNCHQDEYFNPLYIRPYSREAFALYDMHFSPRPHLFDEYKKLGAKNVAHLEIGFDPTVFYPIRLVPGNCIYDVSFVGSWSKDRERLIKRLCQFKVTVYGSGWYRATSLRGMPNTSLMYKCVCLEDFSRVVGISKICLNILTIENKDQINLRNFEIPACGGFQLCDRSLRLTEIFKEGEEIALYEDEEELVDKIRYYLQHENERIKIAQNGYKAVITRGHTYDARCKQLISVIESILL